VALVASVFALMGKPDCVRAAAVCSRVSSASGFSGGRFGIDHQGVCGQSAQFAMVMKMLVLAFDLQSGVFARSDPT